MLLTHARGYTNHKARKALEKAYIAVEEGQGLGAQRPPPSYEETERKGRLGEVVYNSTK